MDTTVQPVQSTQQYVPEATFAQSAVQLKFLVLKALITYSLASTKSKTASYVLQEVLVHQQPQPSYGASLDSTTLTMDQVLASFVLLVMLALGIIQSSLM